MASASPLLIRCGTTSKFTSHVTNSSSLRVALSFSMVLHVIFSVVELYMLRVA